MTAGRASSKLVTAPVDGASPTGLPVGPAVRSPPAAATAGWAPGVGASPEQAVVSRITGRPSARQARREGLMVRFSWDGRGQGSGGGNDRRRGEEPGPGVVIHPDLVRRGRVP